MARCLPLSPGAYLSIISTPVYYPAHHPPVMPPDDASLTSPPHYIQVHIRELLPAVNAAVWELVPPLRSALISSRDHSLTTPQRRFRTRFISFEADLLRRLARMNSLNFKLDDIDREHWTEDAIMTRSVLDEADFAPRPEHKLRYTVAQLEGVRRQREMQEGWKMLCRWKRDRWRSRE